VKRLVIAILVALTGVASAHKPSDAHLRLAASGTELAGQVSIAVRDLDGALDLDTDGNGDITWAETTAAAPRIAAYVKERILLDAGGPCELTTGAAALVDLTDGAYWTAPVTATCPSAPGDLTITYKLLFDIDAQHRGLVHLQAPGFAKTLVIKSAQPVTVAIANPTAVMSVLSAGGRALAIAPLLLLALLLLPVRRKTTIVDDVALAATFALAQVATFVLAAAGQLDLPADWVAPVIGLSVAAVGVANVFGAGLRRRGVLAIELGAIHGFALAFAFGALDLPARGLPVLLAFGAGAVLAQVAIGAVLAGVLVALRKRLSPTAIVLYASVAATVAGVFLALR